MPNETPVKRAAVEFRKEKAIILPDTIYSVDIVPNSKYELQRAIEVQDRSVLEGKVYGATVEIGMECHLYQSIFARDWVSIGLMSRLAGDVLSNGSVVIEDKCRVGAQGKGSVVADVVRIGNECLVEGNVIARRSIEIGADSVVKGIVCCTAGPVHLGRKAVVRDVVSAGPLNLAPDVKVMDDVIWSRTSLETDGLEMAGQHPGPVHHRLWEGAEVNLNTDRVSRTEIAPFTTEDGRVKALREILLFREK